MRPPPVFANGLDLTNDAIMTARQPGNRFFVLERVPMRILLKLYRTASLITLDLYLPIPWANKVSLLFPNTLVFKPNPSPIEPCYKVLGLDDLL